MSVKFPFTPKPEVSIMSSHNVEAVICPIERRDKGISKGCLCLMLNRCFLFPYCCLLLERDEIRV